MKNISYGIDFGTTNTAVAHVTDKGRVQIIPLDKKSDNPNILRSVIYASPKTDLILFGDAAVKKYNQDVAEQKAAKKKVIHTGRLIKVSSDASAKSGFKPDKIVEQVYEAEITESGRLLQSIKSLLANETLKEIDLFGKKIKVEELVGIFLKEVKSRADNWVQKDVKKAVIGHPVRFVGKNDKLAKERLVEACALAGFSQIKLQKEPVGAAFDFGIKIKEKASVLVFDFGGGTLDLSVVMFPEKKVLINKGIPLGGDLINSQVFLEKIAQYFGKGETYGPNSIKMPESLYQQLRHWYVVSLLKTERFAQSLDHFEYMHSNPESVQNLRSLIFDNLGFLLYEEVDRVKKGLSNKDGGRFAINLKRLKIDKEISRKEFEEIISGDLIEIEKLIATCLEEAGLAKEDVDNLVLTGGSSLIPAVRSLLIGNFGEEKLRDQDTFTSVARGLAIYADKIFN